ncbi:MAG: hypothetical protein GC162_20370 [Planctomycetes bacterium]|nr:hypothetical protein [Planctomycetota bacterium]
MGDRIGAAFQDGTHHNAYGSYELARCVVHGIRETVPELAKHLRSDPPDFNPAEPDAIETWRIPPSPDVDTTKPDGN